MHTDIISLDSIAIEEIQEKPVILLINETETILPGTTLPPNRRFGIADLWKIRSTKRHFAFYR